VDPGPLSQVGVPARSRGTVMREASIRASMDLRTRVYRAVTLEGLAGEWAPELGFAVLDKDPGDREAVERLRASGMDALAWIDAPDIEDGDVFVKRRQKQRVNVLFRPQDKHHTLFMTNRCNSNCMMCSQPPTPQDDSWLVLEASEALRHVRVSPRHLGLTGGEPLLLGASLRALLDLITQLHPNTKVDLLTNGRLLADSEVSKGLLNGLLTPTSWLVPLYGHADFVHDFVVQARGAFEETIAGLLALQEYGQPIQLRIVLIEPVLRVLPELCAFIGRNLPFVREVALMACEPTGFALANASVCEVDLKHWRKTLELGLKTLQRHRVPFMLMNAPLCALPRSLWPFAMQSISDWKNVYASECEICEVKNDCAGLFASHVTGWRPTRITPTLEAA
jgi:His-Xaa-Ser system radical SAM maturase HxsC